MTGRRKGVNLAIWEGIGQNLPIWGGDPDLLWKVWVTVRVEEKSEGREKEEAFDEPLVEAFGARVLGGEEEGDLGEGGDGGEGGEGGGK